MRAEIKRVLTLQRAHLPAGWELATLTELIGEGGVFSDGDWVESKDQDPNGNVRLIQLADIGDGYYRDRSSRFLTSQRATELRCTFLGCGDLLIARMPDPLGRACIFPGDIKRSVTAVDVCIVRTGNSEVSHRWLMYAVNSPATRAAIAGLQSGSTRKRISRKNLARIELPVPPIVEQHCIVAEIETQFTRLDAGIAALKRAQANLRRYKASVLKAACEGRLVPTEAELTAVGADGVRPPYKPASALLKRILSERRAKWEETQCVKEVHRAKQKAAKAQRKAVGRPLRRGERLSPQEWQDTPEAEYARYLPKDDKWKAKYKEPAPPDTTDLPDLPEGWVWATLPQLGGLNRGKSKHRPRNDPRLYGGPYPFIQTGDVKQAQGIIRTYSQTYSESGLAHSRLWPKGTLCITIAANIAESAILDFEACFPDSIVGFLADGSHCDVHFIEFFIRIAKEDLKRYAPATAQKNINLRTLSQLGIVLPPLAEQHRIVAEVERRLSVVQELEATVEANLKRAERLRRAILKRAFEGKLVPQDPNDEPASVLLERMRATRDEGNRDTKPSRVTRGRKRSEQLPLL